MKNICLSWDIALLPNSQCIVEEAINGNISACLTMDEVRKDWISLMRMSRVWGDTFVWISTLAQPQVATSVCQTLPLLS
jgi:hypothetical protein